MSVDAVLSRLDKVRKTGQGRWIACCPAHDDKRPSMTIRELDDGRILLHDFGGCSAAEILDSVGLEWDALFPEKPIDGLHAKRERCPFNAHDILKCISFEALIVHQCSSILLRGESLNETDHERLVVAASRIGSAERLAHGA